MTRDEALSRLPMPYAVGLRLRDRAADAELIAHALGVELEAVGSLLRLAEAKLAAALESDVVPAE